MGLREEIISILSKWKLEIQADNHRPVIDVADEILSTQPKLEEIDEKSINKLKGNIMTYTIQYGVLRSQYPDKEKEMDILEKEMRDYISTELKKYGQAKLEEIDEVYEALKLILPLAKGYVHKNQVGSNVKYIQIAEQVLEKYGQAKADWEGETEGELYKEDRITYGFVQIPTKFIGKKVLVKLYKVEK